MKNIHLLLICILAVACSGKKTAENNPQNTAATTGGKGNQTKTVTYRNPVMPGDFADPSVIRVGEEYWATATSSEWAPLYPILYSKNLVDWEIKGHVFPDKMPDWAEAHFWAPEITYDKGKYYIYYTAKKKGGNLCVGVASATKPTGPYTDHGPLVCQEVGSIDGFPIRDDKGELYLIWKEDANSVKKATPIWGQRMNEERTALEGKRFELFRNTPNTWEGGLVEGPALMKRNGYYYMFYAGDACCGRACTYGVGVARAKDLKGPWERFTGNPILKKNNEWQCPGHGTVVTDSQGRDFFLYHAYNAKSSVYPGRQGLLDEVIWNDNGWPSFKNNSPSITAAAPFNENAPDNLNVADEFAQTNLSQIWQWPVNEKPQFTLVANNNGLLSLKASPEDIGTVLAQRTYTADYAATTALHKSKLPAGTMAGLSAIGDNGNAVGLGIRGSELVLWSVRENKVTTLAQAPAPQSDVLQFKLTTTKGDKMQFAYSTDGANWTSMNNGQTIDASYLPPWDRGVRVGFTVKGPAAATATFDYFKLVNAAE